MKTFNRFLTLAVVLCIVSLGTQALATTYYSTGSADIATLANWNSNRDGVSGSAPANFTTAGDIFVIQGSGNGGTTPHASTLAGVLTIGSGANNTKLQIENGASLTATAALTFGSAGIFQIDNGGTYNHNNAGALATALFAGVESFGPSSNFVIGGSASPGTGPSTVSFTGSFGNFTFSTTSVTTMQCNDVMPNVAGNFVKSSSTAEFRMAGSSAVNGGFTIGGDFTLSAGIFSFGNGTVAPNLTISGNFSMTGGTFQTACTTNPSTNTLTLNKAGVATFIKSSGTITAASSSGRHISVVVPSGTTLDMGTNILNCAGSTNLDFTVASGGTVRLGDPAGIVVQGTTATTGNIQTSSTSVRSFSTSGNYQYTGVAAQVTGSGLPTSVNNFTVNNSAGVTLSSNLTVAGTLALTSGTLAPSANTLTANGSVTRTTGYVDGTLARAVGSGGTPTVDFYVGTGARYTPVSVAFTSTITGAGTLTTNSTGSEHSSIGTSGLDGSKDINRFFTVTNSGVTPTDYDVTLNWDAADVDGGATPANFVVKKYDTGVWTSPVSSSNQSATSIKGNGFSSFSEFAVGETSAPPSDAPVVDSPIGAGATSVAGTSTEGDGTTILIYIDNVLTDSTTVTSAAWTKTGLTALTAGQTVKAKARASGEDVSPFSNTVTVQAFTAAPVVSAPISVGATSASGTSSEADGTSIDVYVDGSSVGTTTVSSGAWTKTGLTALTLGQQVKAKATAAGKLESGFSNIVTVTNVLSISTSSPLPNATAGSAYSTTLTAAGGTAPYDTWTVVSGSLPPSMGLNLSTGEISGTSLVAGVYNFTVQVKDALLDSVTKPFQLTVDPGSLDHFSFASISSPQTAGTSFGITITAQDANNNTVTAFTGTVPLSTTAGSITPSVSGSFTLGVRNENVTVTLAGTGKTIGADDGASHTGTSNTFDVDAGALHHFGLASISSPQVAGTSFGITITAQDLNNNTVTGFVGTVTLSTTAGTITPSTSGSFTLGVRGETVSVTQSGTGKTISVDDGSSHTGTSNSFDVNPGALDHFSITTITSPKTQNVAFNLVMTAKDLNNNTVTAFTGTVTIALSTGTIAPLTSAAFVAGARTEPVTISTTGTGLTINVDDGASHAGTSNSFDVNAPAPFRSFATGNWNSNGTWETFDGVSWVAASSTPTASEGSITIRNGHTVTVTANVSADEMTIDAGGTVAVDTLITFTVANGTGTDLDVNGSIRNKGTITLSSGNVVNFNNGSYYEHKLQSAAVPKSATGITVSWAPNSTVEVTGPTSTAGLSGMFTTVPANADWGNIIWNTTGFTGTGNFNFGGNLTSIKGNFTMLSTGSGPALLRLLSSANSNVAVTISGDLIIQGGTFQFGGGNVANAGSSLTIGGNWNQTAGTFAANVSSVTLPIKFTGANKTFTQSGGTLTNTGINWFVKSGASLTLNNNIALANSRGDTVETGGTLNCGANTISGGTGTSFVLQSGGTLGIGSTAGITAASASGNIQTATRSYNTGGNYTYNGGAAQVTGDGLPATVNNLTINNGSGVTLTANTTVNGTLGFSSGLLATGANTVTLSTSGTSSGAGSGKYVYGNLARVVPASGSPTFGFDIGDATTYAPVSVAFNTLSSGGTITSNTTAGDHASLGSSGIWSSKSVNRYWTLTNGTAAFTSYDATFNFANPGDLDGGANPGVFQIEKYDGAWTNLAVGTRTSTSTQATGVTSFSDFAIGEALPAGSFYVSPLSLTYGSVITGNSKEDSVYVKNLGPGILHVTSISSANADFSVNPASDTIALNDSAWIKVTYTPSADGADAGDIVFVHDGGGSPDTVTVTGTGYTPTPLFSVAPGTLNFGTVSVGNSKTDSTFVINTGTSTLHVSSVTSDNGLFTAVMDQDSVEAGDTVKVTVTFTPLANGAQAGNIVFVHDAAGSPDTVGVTGTGLILAPIFTVNPSSVNFGSVLNSTTKPESVYVKNTGTSSLSVSSVASDNARYTVVPGSATVAAGDSAKFVITFSPLSAGATGGNISFTHNATGSPDTVTVSGVGIAGATTILSNGTGGGSWTIGSTWQGGIAPSSIDSVVILGSDSVYVLSGSTSSGLFVQAGGKLSLNAKLVPTNFVLNGKAVVYADTLQPSGSVSVGGAGTYQHARDGGRILRGAWADGSTLLVTGVTGTTNIGGAPGQSYYNIAWNSPGQVANTHMGMHAAAQGDTTTTIRGDVTILSTGGGRAYFAAPTPGIVSAHTISRINITGNVNVSGTATFATHGTSSPYTDIIVNHNGNINVTGGNFSVSRGSQGTTGTTTWYLHSGNFSMSNATTQNSTTAPGVAKFVFDKVGTQTLTLGGGNTISALPIEVGTGTTFDMGVSQIRGSGLFTLNAGATLRTANAGGLDSAISISGTKTYSTFANFAFNGSVAQVSGKSLPIAMNSLTMNNASGMSLDTTTTVSGILTLTSGNVSTGPYILSVGSGGSVSRTSGHVVGTLQKNVATGPVVSRTYEIGDTGAYTPVIITFANVGTAGSLSAASHQGEHPNLGTSNIDPAKDVNRYWTMSNSGIIFTTYDGVFNFVAGDVDGGAVPSAFIGQKYNGAWSNLTEGTKTATSTEILGATSFSDFAFGDTLINSYDIAASSGPNGTIIPSGIVTVGDGANPDFIFSAAIGYHVDSIYVDGGYTGDSAHYQFFNVVAPHTIHVTFAINMYTLSVNVVGNGSVAKDPDQLTYAHGSSVDLSATPGLASLFTGWSGDASGAVNPLSVLMDGNKSITATFGDDPIYQVSYRSFSPDSIALDKDNKGKVGKYVKRKADKVYFKFQMHSPPGDTNKLPLTLKFGILTSGAITRGTQKLDTLWVWSNEKTVVTGVLDTGTIQIDGIGYKGKPVKVSYIWATAPKVTKGTITAFLLNQPKLPMPNRVNALLETFEQGAFVSTTGLPVGLLKSDLPKFYAWYRAPKYTDVLKTLSDKNGRHNLASPKFLAFYTTGKLMKGLLKSLPPSKQNNGLVANLVTLKLNIAASQLGKTPPGYGELMYDGATDSTSVFNGMKITDIATKADTIITGYSNGVIHIGQDSMLGPVNAVIRKLNDAFEGPLDTADFATKLHFTGARKLVDVPYLKVIPGLEPTILAATENPIIQVPDEYKLNQNYPNPFNPTTTISFDLPEQAFVTLKVYNMLGQEVATLVENQPMDDGTQEFQFDASNLSSGVYFYRIIAQGFDDDGVNTTSFITSKKMLLVK